MIPHAEIWERLDKALKINEAEILQHIERVYSEKRMSGIESVFAKAFLSQFEEDAYEEQVPGSRLGVSPWFPSRTKEPRVDCYFKKEQLAIEFKAGRIPRNYQNEFYDISQVASDILRLRDSQAPSGYMVLFAYGPLVSGTNQKLDLYKAFHNAYFVDYAIGKMLADSPFRINEAQRAHIARCELLGWNRPYLERGLPDGCIVKRTKDLGAICIDCKPGATIPEECVAR